ncbi:MAG: hypothetical protein V2A34_00525, partial [Lentisphaerota bacterium]
KTEAGWLVFRLSFADQPESDHLRLMLDMNGPGSGEPGSGADFMVEGNRAFRYPEGARDWSWDEVQPPLTVEEGHDLFLILREPPEGTTFRWFASLLDDSWTEISRYPQDGTLAYVPAGSAASRFPSRLFPENLNDLISCTPRSLSFRLDAEIKSRIWEKGETNAVMQPMWKPLHAEKGIPLRFFLVDAVSGQRAPLEPSGWASCSNTVKWTGMTLDVAWTAVVEPLEGAGIQISMLVQSAEDRCLQVALGSEMEEGGWIWHDDLCHRRFMTADGGVYHQVKPSAYGLQRLQSVYPFGVLSSTQVIWSVETDPDEPRSFDILADPSNRFFGILYDAAVTRLTSNFPSSAAFRCAFRSHASGGQDAFRVVLDDFLRRNSDFGQTRISAAGTCAPVANILSVSNAQDFGFSFGVLDGPFEGELPKEILGFLPVNPWTLDLPLEPRLPWSDIQAIQWMRLLMALKTGPEAEFLSGALLGAARTKDGSRPIRLDVNPDLCVAHVSVNADPELPVTTNDPMSQAMAEWRFMRQASSWGFVQGFKLDGFSRLNALDYNSNAIAVADYPCVYDREVLRPGLAAPIAAMEFLVPAAACLRANGKFLMGDWAMDSAPEYIRYLDIPLIQTGPGPDFGWDEAFLAHARALSGSKPVCAQWNSCFKDLDRAKVERYLDLCMAFAFLPGFGESGKGESYWQHPEWFERDRPLFKNRIPRIQRMAVAGWRAMGEAHASKPEISVEQFGRASSTVNFFSLRNLSNEPVSFDLLLPAGIEPVVLLDPLSGWCRAHTGRNGVEKGMPFGLSMQAAEIRVLDRIPLDAMDEEDQFLRQWESGGRESEACLRNLESIRAELAAKAVCRVDWPVPSVVGEDNRLVVRVDDEGDAPMRLSDLKLISSKYYRDSESAGADISAEGSGEGVVMFYASDVVEDSWLEVQWALVAADKTTLCSRLFKPQFVQPLEVRLEDENTGGRQPPSAIELSIRNNTSQSREVLIKLLGNVKGVKRQEILDAHTARRVQIPVEWTRKNAGELRVEVFEDGKKVFEHSRKQTDE